MGAREAILLLAAARAAAAECVSIDPVDQNTAPLVVTQADPVPGSVQDGLLVKTGGAVHTIRVDIRVKRAPGETGKLIEQVHVGPFLPSSGFPVLWVNAVTGAASRVSDGEELPLSGLLIDDDPETLRVTLAVDGPGGGFAGTVPEPLIVLGFSGSPGEIEIAAFEAYAPDGDELTSLFLAKDLCLTSSCEPRVIGADFFDAALSVSRPDAEPGSVDDGLLLRTAGEVQSGDFEVLFDDDKLLLEKVNVGPFFIRGGCPVAFAPARGPGEVLPNPLADIPPSRVIERPGRILFGLASLGLCPPPSADGMHEIAILRFRLRPEISRREDVEPRVRAGPGTKLFGSDGAEEIAFYRRVGACYLFPGQCDTVLSCVLTPDCLGAELSWTNASYESVDVLRDGFLLARLPAGSRTYVDPRSEQGLRSYSIRGVVAGEPCRERTCAIEIPEPLICPGAFTCELVSREDGRSAIRFGWVNDDSYDSIRVLADGQTVAVAGPGETSAELDLGFGGAAVPLDFTLETSRGGKTCEARCSLFPVCIGDLVCSEDSSGHPRLDWTGGAGMVTVLATDLATGESSVAAAGAGLVSFVDTRGPPGPLGVRYVVSAVEDGTGKACGFESSVFGATHFIRGDFDANGLLNVTDAVRGLDFLFRNGTAPSCVAAADANGDGDVSVSDPIAELLHLFSGGREIPPPFPGCGPDEEDTGLSCASFAACPGKSAFPGPLTCAVDGARRNVNVSWSGGTDIAELAVRLGSGPRQTLSAGAHSAVVLIQPEAYGRTLPVILEAELETGGRFARSCEVAVPAAAGCASGLALELVPGPGSGTIRATWAAAGVTVTLRKDTGTTRTLGPGVATTTFPTDAGDWGRVVSVTLSQSRPFGGPCSQLSAQVEVPAPFACFGPPSCSADAVNGVIRASWTAGVNLPDLEIQKGDALPVSLAPSASSAVLPLAEADYGRTLQVTLRTSSGACAPRECSVAVPPAPVRCFTGLACAFEGSREIIRADWTPAENLSSLRIEKDGVPIHDLPPDADGANILVHDADRNRTVSIVLRGFDASGSPACLSSCQVFIPPAGTFCEAAESISENTTVFGRNDAPGSTQVVQLYGCDADGSSPQPGPEYAYAFTAAATETLLVSLTGISQSLSFWALQGGGACDPSQCVVGFAVNPPGVSLALPIDGGSSRYFVVDSPGGVSSYQLDVSAVVEGPCSPSNILFCGSSTGGSNSGGTHQRFTYSCQRFVPWTGPEVAYDLFTSGLGGQQVTIRLDGLSADLDLFVLEDTCDGSSCLRASLNSGVDPEVVAFQPVEGSRYFAVVDGFDGAVSSYQLQVQCGLPQFQRGDANGDGNVGTADAIFISNAVAGTQTCPCEDACDVNDDGLITEDDRNDLLDFLFGGGSPPPLPFPNCGPDPTPDSLDCVQDCSP